MTGLAIGQHVSHEEPASCTIRYLCYWLGLMIPRSYDPIEVSCTIQDMIASRSALCQDLLYASKFLVPIRLIGRLLDLPFVVVYSQDRMT